MPKRAALCELELTASWLMDHAIMRARQGECHLSNSLRIAAHYLNNVDFHRMENSEGFRPQHGSGRVDNQGLSFRS